MGPGGVGTGDLLFLYILDIYSGYKFFVILIYLLYLYILDTSSLLEGCVCMCVCVCVCVCTRAHVRTHAHVLNKISSCLWLDFSLYRCFYWRKDFNFGEIHLIKLFFMISVFLYLLNFFYPESHEDVSCYIIYKKSFSFRSMIHLALFCVLLGIVKVHFILCGFHSII